MKRKTNDGASSMRKISRRALMLGGVQLGFTGALALRMGYLQVEQADQFRLLAEQNRINIRLLPPARGLIFDRNGVPIAKNEPSYRITMVREDTGDPEAILKKLATIIPLSDEQIQEVLKEARRSAPFLPVTVADRITWDDLTRVAVNAPALPGITPDVGLSRTYPLGSDFAHVVGYVGPVSDYDLSRIEDPDQLLRIPRFQIGKVGLEAKKEEALRGKAGALRVEVNAVGRVMRELDRREGKAGADIQLAVDAKLQNYLQARLGNESASAVVIDCETGDLLAIASAPTFDPNLFVRGISVADYKALTDHEYRPLASKSVQGLYPPGSTFKMVTALAALEEGVIGPDETVHCPGHLEVSGRRFHCWKRSGHGHVNLETSLAESCDVYYYDLALKIGIEKISAMAEKLGIGERFDIPMSAVARGRAPTKQWKLDTYDKEWVIGDTVNASIGQGLVQGSPLQLAVMAARLATGRSVTPRMIKTIDGTEQPTGHGDDLGLNPANLRKVQRAMYAVSNSRRGTAYGSRTIGEDLLMAGKTGTSQVRNISEEERRKGVIRNEDLPWRRRDHALFVNYAPFNNPKVAVAVVVEHGGGGSSVAAPIARDITLQALYGEDPPLSAYPEKDRSRVRALQERLKRERLDTDNNGLGRA